MVDDVALLLKAAPMSIAKDAPRLPSKGVQMLDKLVHEKLVAPAEGDGLSSHQYTSLL